MRKRTPEKRQQILDTSRRMFLKLGYHDTSLDVIAEEAQVSKQTIYGYFPNKRALFLAMLDEIVGGQKELEAPPKKIGSAEELRETLYLLAGHIDAVISDPNYVPLVRVVVADAISDPTLRKIMNYGIVARSLKSLTNIFKAAKRDGIIQVSSPSNAARLFLGGFVTRLVLDGFFSWPEENGIKKMTKAQLRGYVDDFMRLA